MSRILIVDDKEMMRDSVATTLSRRGHAVVTASSARDAVDKLAKRSFDLIITDLQMPEMSGLDLLEELRRIDEQIPVVFMTAYGTVETAVAAMKQGAFDYITKPFSGDVLLITAERAMEHGRLVKENQILRVAGSPGGTAASPGRAVFSTKHEMVGDGPQTARLRENIGSIADSHGTVLISGESGSGKEVAARAIHMLSPRANAPFLALNCAALSTSLLESELFGHEKGAFTGADKLRKGRFELADGGTLLLDEISEIGPEIQAKLLRVLQERAFERVGSSASRDVDVRIIATTNRDLPAEVAKGGFRQDLYFRLNVLPLAMPALRSHPEDIPALAAHFLGEVAKREGKPPKRFDEESMALLRAYAWPGNVRELQNICERAAVLTGDDVISASLVAPWLSHPQQPPLATSHALSNGHPLPDIIITADNSDLPAIICDGNLTLDEIERQTIVATLEHNRGHRQRSAEALGIGVRTLGLKLKKWKELQLVDQAL
jgi:two-component system, NtrC family, response regulator HydG